MQKPTNAGKQPHIAQINDAISHQSIAEPTTILRGLVGSSVHGLVLSGTDDRDEMGVCVEDRRYVIGFGKFEQWVYRSAAEREGRAGARSRAGDLDLTVYSLCKWARLALQGNPTVLLLLFLPDDALVISNNRWGGASKTCTGVCIEEGREPLSWLPGSTKAAAYWRARPARH